MEKMPTPQIESELSTLPEWAQVGDSIQRTYDFRDFVQAMKFVNKVAEAAELTQHHPDILVRYKRVTLTIATHDAHGITHKDFALARTVDGYLKKPSPAKK